MSHITNLTRKRISLIWVSLALFSGMVVSARGQREESTASAGNSRATRGITHMELNEDALQSVIKQFQGKKPGEWAVKPESVRKFYTQDVSASRLNKSKAVEHVQLAATLEKNARLTGQPVWLAVSELAYRSTIKRTEGTTQLWASSNYCAQLLRHKKFDEAVKVMQNVEPTLNDTSLNPIAKSRALYNLGKSLQMSGQHKQAYDVLKRSMDADPTFRKAAVAAGQSALKADRETTGIPQVLELTDSQLKHFGYGGAANNLRQALQVPRWQRSHLYPRLMRQLVRYFTITQVSPETFKKDWSEFLQLLYKNLASDHLCRQMVHQIRMVYSDTDSQLSNMDLIPRRIQRFYNVWRKALDRPGDNSEIAFLSEFIKMVGDHYYRQRDPNSLSKCMTRYSHAWGLDAHNIDAGIYLADTLLYARKNKDLELDPEGEILRGYIFLLFAIKGEEYQRELGKDWDKIMKCHVILAKIFEELKQWWGPDHNAETARFQWTAAQRALNMPGVSPEDREWFGPAIIKGIEEAERHRN